MITVQVTCFGGQGRLARPTAGLPQGATNGQALAVRQWTEVENLPVMG